MKLYEINNAIRVLLESSVDPDTGEIIADLSGLDTLEIDRLQKITDVACYIKGLDCEAEAIREEEKGLAKRRRSLESRVEWLRGYLKSNLDDGEKVSDSRVVLSWRKSVAVVINDEEAIPDDYYIVKRDISKGLISDALKRGTEVPGAALVERHNLVIK